jgi:integrase
VSRPRKHDKHLPAYVRIKSGAYYYRGSKLCRVSEGESRLYELLAERMRTGNVQTIPAAVAAFKLTYLPTLAPSSREGHARHLSIFAAEFEEFRVDQVRPVHIKRSIMNLYGDKPTAAHHYRSRISTFFQWCVDDAGLLDKNPGREVRIAAPRPKRSPWTDDLFHAVRDLLSPMQQCYHDLSFLLYQRTTDVRMLMWSQVRSGVIHFAPTKTIRSSGKEVDIPITPAIQAVLDRAKSLAKIQAVGRGDAYVIQTSRGGPFTAAGIYSAYDRADRKLHGDAGKVLLNPKALRPYAATAAKKQGYGIEALQVGLAHTSVRTTEGYVQSHEVPQSAVNLKLPERKS